MPNHSEGRILIIAPDRDLRRSLEFALEAEGYVVVARPAIDSGMFSDGGRFDCTVLDHAATRQPMDAVIAFCARARPIVLLSNRVIPWLAEWVAVTVEKPSPGSALSVAIQSVMHAGPAAGTPK